MSRNFNIWHCLIFMVTPAVPFALIDSLQNPLTLPINLLFLSTTTAGWGGMIYVLFGEKIITWIQRLKG